MPVAPTLSDRLALGPNAKIDMQVAPAGTWLPFSVIEGSYSVMGQKSDVTDSENAGQTSNAVGLETFSLTATIQLDAVGVAGQRFAIVQITPNNLVGLTLYPWGRAVTTLSTGGIAYYFIPAFRITGCDGTFVVQGSRPQTLRFSGESDNNGGNYLVPGDFLP